MESLTSRGEITAHSVARIGRFQQLDLALTGREQGRPYPLIGKVSLPQDRQTERIAIEAVPLGEPSYHDPHMMNASYHGESPP
jgi:hypothetical protein